MHEPQDNPNPLIRDYGLRGLLTGPMGIAAWSFLATAVSTFGLHAQSLDPARLTLLASATALELVVVGAVAALAPRGWRSYAACVVGSAIGLGLNVLISSYFADPYQGHTVVMAREPFVAFAFALLFGAFLAVGAGYGLTAALLARVDAQRAHGRAAGRALPWVVLATALIAAVLSGATASWMGGTRLVLDPTSSAEVVHRVTISATTITVDVPVVASGDVIWLATVVGDAPRDLTLLDESGRTHYGMETPPSGSVDFLLARMTMAPGSWALTAGYAGVPTTGLETPEAVNLPLFDSGRPVETGRLVARFEVAP